MKTNSEVIPSRPAKGWKAVKQYIKDWKASEITDLLKNLYDISPENRIFIDARVQETCGGDAALATYRSRIVEQFFPKRGFGKLKLGEARKAIRDYHKATGNVTGTAELLMTYVENGAQFTRQYGDIDERFYNSVESALDELATLLKGSGRDLYFQFNERLGEVKQLADGIGWGFSDYIADVVDELADHAENAVAITPKNNPKNH